MFVYAKDCKVEVLENGVKRVIKNWIGDLMAVELTWGKGMVGAVHTHPHRQCGYCVKGRFEAEMNGEKAVLEAGDCFYAEAGVPHGLTALEDDSVFLDIFTPYREDFVKQLQGGA
jgi:quercetin dioxygenase-like cupin family protein